MQIRLRDAATAELACRTRLPYRFGDVTLNEAPLLHLRVIVEATDGRSAAGMASDLLVPRWFCRATSRPSSDDQAALRASVTTALARYREHDAATAFAHWQQVHEELIESQPGGTPDLLERGYGVALVERAMIDAVCRLQSRPFAAALADGLLGRHFPRPRPPLERIALRHTVGRLDPLRAADIAAEDRLDDGMPQALDEVLETHHVRWLKIKIGGTPDDDVARLLAIGRLLTGREAREIRVTLDGNEQFDDFDALRAVWQAVASDRHGAALLQRVQWVEQPLPRALSLGGAPDWNHCPLLLDEADAQRRSWPDSGYHGVSVKNCKSVFRALLNAERAASDPGLFQSSEDLTSLPALAVQQDLCTAAALGLEHSEHNENNEHIENIEHNETAKTSKTTKTTHVFMYVYIYIYIYV